MSNGSVRVQRQYRIFLSPMPPLWLPLTNMNCTLLFSVSDIQLPSHSVSALRRHSSWSRLRACMEKLVRFQRRLEMIKSSSFPSRRHLLWCSPCQAESKTFPSTQDASKHTSRCAEKWDISPQANVCEQTFVTFLRMCVDSQSNRGVKLSYSHSVSASLSSADSPSPFAS